jgi:hypothetical protein
MAFFALRNWQARRAESKAAEREARIRGELDELDRVRGNVDALLDDLYGAFGPRGGEAETVADKLAALDEASREALTPSRVYDDLLGIACSYAIAFRRDCAEIDESIARSERLGHVRRTAEHGRSVCDRMRHILDCLERDRAR